MKQSELLEARDTHCSDKCCGSDVKAQDCKCPPTCKHCNCNAKNKMDEGLAELAGAAERDHEVQMARAELYKIAKYAIKLHEILKGVSEAEGIEGWMQSKITKSADYMSSVYHSMDYENKFSGDPEQDLKASYEDLEEKETKVNLEDEMVMRSEEIPNIRGLQKQVGYYKIGKSFHVFFEKKPKSILPK